MPQPAVKPPPFFFFISGIVLRRNPPTWERQRRAPGEVRSANLKSISGCFVLRGQFPGVKMSLCEPGILIKSGFYCHRENFCCVFIVIAS